MQRMLIALGALIVLASPALSQNWSRWDDRDSSDHEDRGRSKRDYPRWHDMDDHHGSGRGARFMVRSGDSVVAVRCDGSEFHAFLCGCDARAFGACALLIAGSRLFAERGGPPGSTSVNSRLGLPSCPGAGAVPASVVRTW